MNLGFRRCDNDRCASCTSDGYEDFIILCTDKLLFSSDIKSCVENLKAHLARECVTNDKPTRRILGMKIFRDWKNRKFWIA